MARIMRAFFAVAVLVFAACAQDPRPAQPLLGSGSGHAVDGSLFSLHCQYSHTNSDDPIIFPGQPGASHAHDFLGNDSTDAFSTYESLQGATTKCQVTLDHAAYWIPALRRADGTPLLPFGSLTYYRNGPGGSVAFPADMRLVARASSATGWACGNKEPFTPSIPDCTGKKDIRAHITFPSCWDGTPVNHVDDTAHVVMEDAVTRACPAGFTTRLPKLALNVRYRGNPHTCVGCTLSSGAPSTLHADFFNAWDQATLEKLVAEINAGVTCNAISDGDPCLS